MRTKKSDTVASVAHGRTPESGGHGGGYTALQRWLELVGIALFFGMTPLALSPHLGMAQEGVISSPWLWGAFALLMGMLLADFTSGVVHWAADNWGDPDWPILGSGFVRPFRHHHVDPEALTRHDFVELNGNNCIISLPCFVLCFFAPMWIGPQYAFIVGCSLVSLAYWVLGTNIFHAWAHTPEPPAYVVFLQRTRLILGKEHHHVHHVPPHHGNYCITTGWLNAPLRWLRFFDMLDWSLEKITGEVPNHRKIDAQSST